MTPGGNVQRTFWQGVGQAFLWAFLLAVGVIVLYPLLWMAFGGFKSNSQIFDHPFALPDRWSLANYMAAWSGVQGYMISSLVVTAVSTVTTVLISAWAAYGLTRTPMPAKPLITAIVLGGMMLSPTVALVPLVRMMQSLGLYDTHWALIILYTAFRVPFTTFLIRAYMLDLPRDLDEAAMMDGATHGQIFRRIILPLCRPIIMSCVVLHILFAWNEYLFAMIFTNSPTVQTLPVGLTSLMSKQGTNFAQVFAAMTLSALPIIIIFFLTQRYFIRGLTEGIGK
ncbi:carbohydrate ABC transporter permease [Paracoccus suum]|uniref:sn-glycerol-3-phosphate transport system permease protein UgpE n=1 Tax=Paracoccus suum TaxID=2259340 RepID=A0A344PIM8_9RHOB|nr:carbohydrate ABC transporter permease [Paracoccus suum]AXC49233.1 carbohydrate ABC transporter permease [Paracoccus suum]